MKKITVTIGIAAYNEEKNIANLLKSLLAQKENQIVIEAIRIASDGSTDSTVAKVKTFGDKRIKCIDDQKRLGKPSRLNYFFKKTTSDVLVIIDADMICQDEYTIQKIALKFKNKKVGFASGGMHPLKGKTLVERAVNNYFIARTSVEKTFDFGKTSYPTHGFVAYSIDFLKDFRLPGNILNDDAYSYFACIHSKWKYVYAKEAGVFARSAGTLKDYTNQLIRYMKGGEQLKEYYKESIVTGALTLPAHVYLRIFGYQLIHNPLGYILLKIAFYYAVIMVKLSKKSYEVKWSMVASSKLLV